MQKIHHPIEILHPLNPHPGSENFEEIANLEFKQALKTAMQEVLHR